MARHAKARAGDPGAAVFFGNQITAADTAARALGQFPPSECHDPLTDDKIGLFAVLARAGNRAVTARPATIEVPGHVHLITCIAPDGRFKTNPKGVPQQIVQVLRDLVCIAPASEHGHASGTTE